MTDKKGLIHSIETFGAVDGPGIRFIVFMQGCPLRCQFCHNPDSWKPEDGTETTVSELIEQILPYKSFYRRGGVTLSGGEPFMQPEFSFELLKACKEEGLHTAVDTSGAIPISQCEKALEMADMLLLDIKDIDPDDCKVLTGKTNSDALAMLDYCREHGKPVWIRHVLVPGLTLKENKLKSLAEFLKDYPNIKLIELLPFHQLGKHKWHELGLQYKLDSLQSPSQSDIQKAKEIFEEAGLKVR